MKGFTLFEMVLVLAIIAVLSSQALNGIGKASSVPQKLLSAEIKHCIIKARLERTAKSMTLNSDSLSSCRGEVGMPRGVSISSSLFGLGNKDMSFYTNGEVSPGRIEFKLTGNRKCSLFVSRSGVLRNDC